MEHRVTAELWDTLAFLTWLSWRWCSTWEGGFWALPTGFPLVPKEYLGDFVIIVSCIALNIFRRIFIEQHGLRVCGSADAAAQSWSSAGMTTKSPDHTGWLEEFSRSLSHRNYTFCSKKSLLVPSRHSRSLGFQPCIPIFLHPPVHSGPSKFSRPKIWNWSLGNTKANKNLLNDLTLLE